LNIYRPSLVPITVCPLLRNFYLLFQFKRNYPIFGLCFNSKEITQFLAVVSIQTFLLYEELYPRRTKLPLFFRTEKLRNFSIRKNKGSKREDGKRKPFSFGAQGQKVRDKVLRTKARGKTFAYAFF